jgi:GH35 family endo-1,4-beta-xylanase
MHVDQRKYLASIVQRTSTRILYQVAVRHERAGDSWRNDWPVKGRTSYPLLFDRAGQPKPAFYAVIRAASEASSQ